MLIIIQTHYYFYSTSTKKKSTKYSSIEACLTISIYVYLNTKGHRKYAYDIKYHVRKVNNEVTFIDCKFEWT